MSFSRWDNRPIVMKVKMVENMCLMMNQPIYFLLHVKRCFILPTMEGGFRAVFFTILLFMQVVRRLEFVE